MTDKMEIPLSDYDNLVTAEDATVNQRIIPAGTRLIDIFPNGIVAEFDAEGEIVSISQPPSTFDKFSKIKDYIESGEWQVWTEDPERPSQSSNFDTERAEEKIKAFLETL